jgi:formylglycine-generating enzyme required for sulfatase activity
VTRGGVFFNVATYLLPPSRYYYSPYYRTDLLGFRCARAA